MKITIAGGDLRMITVAESLKSRGVECCLFGFDKYTHPSSGLHLVNDVEAALQDAAAVIMPYPCEKDGFLNTPYSTRRTEVKSLFSLGGGEMLFLGGILPVRGENFIDYSTEEDFLLRNAVPTAEGGVALAMQIMDTTIQGAEITVLGYGRIGRYLSGILHHLGAKVTVVARSAKSRTLAEISGVCAVGFDDCDSPLSCADIVFNTVPSQILGERELSVIAPSTAVIDLASLPGGADESLCAKHKVLLIRALGLPGKVAPKTAGKAVFETVTRLLAQRGISI